MDNDISSNLSNLLMNQWVENNPFGNVKIRIYHYKERMPSNAFEWYRVTIESRE